MTTRVALRPAPGLIRNGLVAHWPLSARYVQGGLALDLSGNKSHGTLVNAPTTSPRGRSSALAFNGTNQLITLPNTTAINTTLRTWCGWINPPSRSYQPLIGDTNSGGGPSFRIGTSGTLEWVRQGQAIVGASSGVVPLNAWSHIAVTYDMGSGATVFYINGQNAGSSSATSSFSPSGAQIGLDAFQTLYSSSPTASVSCYNRILSAQEIAWLYAFPYATPNPVVRRQYFVLPAAGVTVALTQQAGAGTIGSLATSRTEALAQTAATGNVGTVTAVVGVTAALTQVAGTGTVGTIAPSQAVTLTQQAGTGTVGTLTAGRAATLAQTAGTGTVGTPVESVSIGLAQTAATGNVGTVTAIVGVTAALSQVAGTGTVGAVVASTSIGLAQTAAAGTIGSIAPSRSAALAQTAGTGTVGTATPGASVGLAQQAGTGTVGSVSATAGSNVTVSLTQQSATGAVGTITASVPVTVSLSQVAAAGTIGAMAPSGAVGVTQVAGTGTVGTITAVSGAVTVGLSQVAGTGTVGSLAWARSLGLGHLIGTGAVGTLTPGGAFIPSVRRTLTLTASARTIAASRLSRTIIIP
jgi:hypothetical protein